MTHTELNSWAEMFYPTWVKERASFIRAILTESDWEYFRLFGIGHQVIRLDGKILPDLTNQVIFKDWNCGHHSPLLYDLYRIAVDFADFMSTKVNV